MSTLRACPQAPLPAHESPAAGMASAHAVPREVLDSACLARLTELDPKGVNQLLERVFKAFEGSATRLMVQLQDARRTGDENAIRYVAHTLKSSSASIGALRLSALCAEVEEHLRTGAAEGLHARVDSMVAEVEIVLQALQHMLEAKP